MKITSLSFIFFYYFIYHTVVVSAKCLQDQHSLLLQLKNNLTSESQSSTKLKLWNENITCCNWSGVTCDNVGHVIGLDLSDESISGGFDNSSSLFSLQYLQKLNLAYNDFNSPIPSGFSKLVMLRGLQELSMSSCGLIDTFPNSLSNLTNLTHLDLSHNNLSGEIPSSLFTLPSMKVIDLSFNRLNGSLHIDKVLELRNLTTLDLSHNNISIIENLANVDLSTIPNFHVLGLASCNLKTFPNFLINQSMLTDIDLSDNQIQGQMPNWIWKQQDLVFVNISHNFISNLERPLQNLPSKLEFLDLHNNKLQGPIPAFPKYAYYLDYSSNNFSAVPQDIGNNLSSMSFLSFSNNNLHGSIPDYLCNASQLLILDISFNKFSGTIPPCLITMTTLISLNMRKNILTGPIPDMFPDSCRVILLDFNGNFLHGSIPKSLSYCSSLEVLDIGSNLIIDRFPCFLNNISNLRVFVLWNNKFNGSIECLHSVENKLWKTIQIVDFAFNKWKTS